MKDKINNLNLDEGMERQLYQLMLNSSDLEESDCEVASTTVLILIFVEEGLILNLIDKIEDPLEKRETLERYLTMAEESLKKAERKNFKNNHYKTIDDRIAESTNKKKPTLKNCSMKSILPGRVQRTKV
ncbi:hypothetical protein DVH24_018911 [Malus domestica]|uniref:Uncharacterized protein n=1 Tax=Malus domestica TaxID=3750 RepID=A0A498HJC0_MALDO|nr:hypothetical protein DVH24_018911 [Malus domestica]